MQRGPGAMQHGLRCTGRGGGGGGGPPQLEVVVVDGGVCDRTAARSHLSSKYFLMGTGTATRTIAPEPAAPPSPEEDEAEARQIKAGDNYRRIARGVVHLAFLRRCWGLLGGWLQVVKQRGLPDADHD